VIVLVNTFVIILCPAREIHPGARLWAGSGNEKARAGRAFNERERSGDQKMKRRNLFAALLAAVVPAGVLGAARQRPKDLSALASDS
jgi:hypothetical protein